MDVFFVMAGHSRSKNAFHQDAYARDDGMGDVS
jgi:hypothetical protein